MNPDTDPEDRPPLHRPDADHYRAAAEAALEQLDWCVAYLHRIRKPQLAAALARNRSEIRRQGGL